MIFPLVAAPPVAVRIARATVACVCLAGLLLTGCGRSQRSIEDEFQRLSRQGQAFYESGEPDRAVEVFRQAAALQPVHPDARQNLANALLRANDPAAAAAEARELIRLNQSLGAAHYLLGAALLRQGLAEAALTELQTAKDYDHTVNAVSYLLGRAYQELGQFEEAAELFEEVIQFEADHPSAHYNLSQVLTRLDRADEAARALDSHRTLLAQRAGATIDQSTVEACEYTQIRAPFRLDQPDGRGVAVTFVDVTAEFLGDDAARFAAPLAVLDINHRGTNDLFVRDGDAQFRLLRNVGSRFEPEAGAVTVTAGARYSRVLVGDLNRDRYEDIVILGDGGLHALRLATNGTMTDVTAFSNLRDLPAVDGLLTDLDFTGNLDLVLVTPGSRSLQVWRNLGNMYFTNATAASGFPTDATDVTALIADDWNGDEMNDYFLVRAGAPPTLVAQQRGGPLAPAPQPPEWPAASVLAVGDLNNDLRNDLVMAEGDRLTILFNGFTDPLILPLGGARVRSLLLVDYDNDGWLDVMAATDVGLKAWRNLGQAGFRETTSALGLARGVDRPVAALVAADFDNDGDTDLVLALEGGGLRVLRNQGGNANRQLKLRLLGTRSNPSGLGIRIELTSGNWRALRTVHQLPIEIGVGRHEKIDTLNVRWFDTLSTDVDTPVIAGEQLALIELIRPTGSCPYLYRWDGTRFAFVTDLLGAAPLGLPVAPGRLIEANPEELVRVGDDSNFRPLDGSYVLQITEELREVLYLDTAQLWVVDHPADTEVHPRDKLVPGRPFPPSEPVLLHRPVPLRQAHDLDGVDVTEALVVEDGHMVSPRQLRPPQQRGYAEPHGVVLDFGPLEVARPLTLVLNGWLRFGGGMANIAASRDPEIPFPFPRLEVEHGTAWEPVDVVVGAPCGKTKTILVELDGLLPPGARRLRLTTAFEIHWDRIALLERVRSEEPGMPWTLTRLAPDRTDLHWRGYSEFEDRPWTQPLTPDYARVRSWPDWRITPSGWCTRYGAVDELLAGRDGGLVILNGGDELTLSFAADRLPAPSPGSRRTYFLWTVGWDKDADFHVVAGDRIEPLPWEGMDDQQYGQETRPPHPGDVLNARYNTRWVGPMARTRLAAPSRP
ncbi:MAG: VCBS repeat-containing protein [Verrucomicrobiae bacterium]|nr:VCBS repeat-containing protein [Verrucomicrobiae bacterium]